MGKAEGNRKPVAKVALGDLPDGALLRRVAARRDEAAFGTLVRRHGPIVLGVCRRVLGQEQDAEDALQATFLVLFRQAGSIRKRESLGSWLYGVAYRIARKARGKRARQRVRESVLTDLPADEATPAWMWQEVRLLLDEEVNRLPAKYRVPFVLCHVEGKTNQQAAQQIGCPLGTVLSRLAWARGRLRRRLTRRGVTFPAALVTALLAERAVHARMPELLVTSTVQAAVLFDSGRTGTATKVAALAEGFLLTQLLRKWAKVAGLAAAGLVGFLVFLLILGRNLQTEPKQQAANLAQAPKPKTDQELLQGKWKVAKVLVEGQEKQMGNVDVVFAGDQCHFLVAGMNPRQSPFRLDASKEPREIDLIQGRGRAWPGIYRLEGDHLQLAVNSQGPERPGDFTGQRFTYYELERQPEGPK
jgi:RNA polymerase sigma-70 factor (ECF subfamily)